MMTKDELAQRISALPNDAHIDDALDRLEVIEMIERGSAAADAGDVLTQDEVELRMAEWRP